MPALPGLDANNSAANPFSGIRKAGQAKRAMNFEKWQNQSNSTTSPAGADKASFDGAKNQMFGGQANTGFGAMRQAKF